MTGIERLRRLASARDEWILGGTLADIAEQIERERDAEAADSPYAAILPEDRDALAWVREHGGLERVKKLLDWVVGHCSTKQQLDFDFWLSGRVMHELGFEEDMADRDEVEGRLLARLMPEGCEWPTVDGRKVDFKTPYQPSLGVLEAVSIYSNGACEVMSHDGIIKPVSEIHVVVPAADGEPLEVGQTVWDENGDELVIGAIEDGGHTVACRYADIGDGIPVHGMWSPSDLTHKRPVLDADGVPIREGDTVYLTDSPTAFVVDIITTTEDGPSVVHLEGGSWHRPQDLTHVCPDSWERIEDDAGCTATKYNERRGTIFTTKQQVARDLVRRCRALAERERGE